MKKILILCFLILCSLGAFAQVAGTGTSKEYSIGSRKYRVYVPNIYNGLKPVPLMFNIHGLNVADSTQERYLDFSTVADTANFIVVMPQGVSNNWDISAATTAGQTDRNFIYQVLDSVKSKFNINPCKIYTSGYSKGGFMSYALCLNVDSPTKAPIFAAMASVCGGISDNNGANGYWQKKNPTHPTPIMQIHGDNDGIIQYNGSNFLGQVTVSTLIDYWVNFNNCNTTPTMTTLPDDPSTSDNSSVEHYVYSGGDRGSSVELYKIINGGHTVPSNKPVSAVNPGSNDLNKDFHAAEVIWQFCSKYCLPYLESTTCTTAPTVSVQPTSKTICSGDNTSFSITASGCIGTALTYQWQVNTGSGFNNLANTSPYSGVTTNSLIVTSATVGLNGYSYRCFVSSCCDNSYSSNASLTVNSCGTPTATIAANATVCQGDASPLVTFTGSNGTTPYTFTYSINGNANQTVTTAGSNSTVSVNAPTSTAGCFTYSLISVIDATSTTNTASGSASICINTVPSITSTMASAVCDSGTVNLSVTVSSGTVNWYAGISGGGSLNTGTSYTTPKIYANTTYYAEVTDNGCTESPRTAVTATVNISPATPSPGSNSPVCEGANINLTASTVSGATYTWVGPNTYSISTQNPTISGATTANAGTYSITATENGCTSLPATTNVVVTATVTPAVSVTSGGNNTICTGTSVTYTATPTNGGSSPSYQWYVNATPSGSGNTFTSTSLADNDVVSCELTSNDACASPTTANSNSITVTVNTSLTPAVSITSGGNNTICTGTSVTYTATPTNGGSSPSYQWYVNATPSGSGNTFTSSSLADNDVVSCELTSNDACASPTTASSNSITVTVNTSLTPAVSITSGGNNTICTGTSVTYTATPTYGGTTPSYQWYVNATPSGSGNTFTSSSLADNDVVSCELTSNDACASPTTANSNSITVTVNTSLTPAVSITSGGNNTICTGTSVTYTATPTNGGSSPSYQWYVNATPSGSGNTFTSTSLADNDVVSSILTSNDACASPTTANSNSITVTVNTSLTPAVSITSGGNNTICTGTSVTYTATPTNGGSSPSYQWYVNATPSGSGSTFTSSSLADNDVVSCVLTSNDACANPTTASSNSITVTVNTSLTPAVSITSGGNNTTCTGTSVTYTATPTFGGTTPSYQWYVNATPSGSGNTFTSSSLADNDVVSCVLTSNDACANPTTASSNSITVTVNTSLTPAVSITSGGNNTICTGTSVTYTATPTNGGSSPSYQWYVNATPSGSGSTFTSSSLADNDVVSCVLTSNDACASPTTASSNSITVTVNTSLTPAIVISQTSGNNPTTPGASVTFTSTATNGGTTPTYQWKLNGGNVGANSALNSYTSSSLANGDVISCVLTSNIACATTSTVVSSQITMTVTSTPSTLTVVITQATVSGNTQLTAVSNGATTYQWYQDGSLITGATSQTYTPSRNGVYHVVASSGSATGTSSPVGVGVTPTITRNGDVLTSNSTFGNQWYIDGFPTSDTTQNINITQNGTYKLVVTINGISSETTIVVNDYNPITPPTGIEDVNVQFELSIAPNPNEGIFTISFTAVTEADFTISITNTLGQSVYTETLNGVKGEYSKQISINAGKGVYLVSITSESSKVVKKVLVY